jgi:hypothetical protein
MRIDATKTIEIVFIIIRYPHSLLPLTPGNGLPAHAMDSV